MSDSDVSVTTKPIATPTVDDHVVGVTSDGVVKLFTVGALPTGGVGDVTTEQLDAATESAIASAVAQANAHSDSADIATTTDAHSYADAGDAATLTAANAYADTVAAGGGVSVATVDSKDAATLSSANSYADSGDAATLSSAQSYADSNDTTTLNSAKAYTDAATVGGTFTPGGTGAVSRSMVTKVKEVEVSVLDYGADRTAATDSTAAFQAAIASGAYNVKVPAGTYKVSNLVIDKYVRIYGEGRARTIVQFTTTTEHGIDVKGDSAYYSNGDDSNVIRLEKIQFKYTGAGQAADKHGMIVRVKLYADELFVNKFTHSGIFTDTFVGDSLSSDALINPGDNTHSPFFMELRNVWSKNNGDYGMEVRFGSNASLYVNCNFDKNGIDGIWHHTGNGLTAGRFQASATYGSTFIGGQCSYNGRYGWNLESGSNITTVGLYAESNGRGTGNTGYVTTPYDYRIGVSKSYIELGTVQGVATDHVEILSPNDRTLKVIANGQYLVGICNGVTQLASTATLAQAISKINQLMTELAARKVLASST